MTLPSPTRRPHQERRAREAPLVPRVDPVTRLPVLILFPHSRCNCRCLMCDIWRATTRDEIAVEELERWLEEWKTMGIERIILSGGEPLLHSRLWELCQGLYGAGIAITLLSTGLLLSRDAHRVAQYCEAVVVSLDGPREIHNQIRNLPRAYEKIGEGVAALRRARRDLPIEARCTVQRANFRHLRATVRAARELGFDQISFLAADVSTDAFQHRPEAQGERQSHVALDAHELPLLAQEIEAMERDLADDFAAGFIAESPLKLRRRLHQYFGALLGQGDFHPLECNAPWVSTVIESDGTVRPCFFQPPLGNLRDAGSLDAVLNSPQALAWRRHLDPRLDPTCRRCVCSLSLRERPSAPQ